MSHATAPVCPDGMVEFVADCEGVELICHLEFEPSETGFKDSMGLLCEPDLAQNITLVSAYHNGEDIAHLLLQYLVDDIEEAALNFLENEDDV